MLCSAQLAHLLINHFLPQHFRETYAILLLGYVCSHELFSLDLTQQMQPRAHLTVQITPLETFSKFLYLQL